MYRGSKVKLDLSVCEFSLYFILCATTGYFATQSCRKFVKSNVSINSLILAETAVEFPSITLCPGFKNGLSLPVNVVNETLNGQGHSPSYLDKIKELSYDRHEFLSHVIILSDFKEENILDQDRFWSEIFHPFEGGRCWNFNVPNKTVPGVGNAIRIGFRWPQRKNFFGCDEDQDFLCHQEIRMFLHVENGFVYNRADRYIGMEVLRPPAVTYRSGEKSFYPMGVFEIKKCRIENLDRSGMRCNGNINYTDWLRCLTESVDRSKQCQYPWDARNSSSLSVCDLEKLLNRLDDRVEKNRIREIDKHIVNETGCIKPCSYMEYKTSEVSTVPVDFHPLNTTSAVHLYYTDASIEVLEEYVVFDGFSLMGEVGGTMGIFLGWSIVEIAKSGMACIRRRF